MHDAPRDALPRLLYVEDDEVIAEMAVDVLSESYRVEHVADGRLAKDRVLSERFDVIVIDRRLPGLDGMDLVRAIRTAHITTPVLLFTALGSVADRVEGLDAGANDYLVKPFDYDELVARLRSLVRGYRIAGERREIGEWVFVPASAALYGPAGGRVALTATEVRLLSVLSESPDHVFSREELLGTAFSSDDSLNSVDTYVHYIRRKSAPEIIETVRGRGYRAASPL
ncbi:response regulator transcription factor [Microbacterium sp. B2969]|uniref:Response regulator transcription factor n=1 Tax=Microbacterium alkaliflavum TaxID=3248839 RepID=A0ABW7Q727_9MICO